MATNVSLTSELEQFARSCVESGRYNNVSEVVRCGLRLLQDAEERRMGVLAMLQEAEAEAEREGDVALDDVLAEADQIIAQSRQ